MNQRIEFNTPMWAGGVVLTLLGSVLAAIGMLLGGIAVISAARQWIRQLETPPSETAKKMLGQLQAAAIAGANAWQEGQEGVGTSEQ